MKKKTLDLTLRRCFIPNLFSRNVTVAFNNNKTISALDFKNNINFYLRKFKNNPINILVFDLDYIYFVYIDSSINYVFRYYIRNYRSYKLENENQEILFLGNIHDKIYKYSLSNNLLKL